MLNLKFKKCPIFPWDFPWSFPWICTPIYIVRELLNHQYYDYGLKLSQEQVLTN